MAVGLMVSGRVASTIISKLINELIEYAKDQKKMQAGLKDELARLEKALPKIQAVLNGVDQGLIRDENPPLEKWLWQLRDAADQADDVMDEIKYNYEKERAEAEKNKVITNFKTFFLRAVDKDPFLKRLKEAVKTIDEVVADVGEFYMLVQDLVKDQKKMVKSVISSRESSSLLNVGTHVFGRENEKEDIIQKLLNPNCKNEGNNFVVLPIIGVGGIGKTTLAQLVYNDPIIEKHFELRLWVCISNNFDVVLLTKKLYESAFGQRADFNSFDLIQKKLKEKLESRRFLVVFDDVWNDNNKQDWEKLIAPLKNGKKGSMMLLTTRIKAVARLTRPNLMNSIILEGLNECEMWNLFKECAFGGEVLDYHKDLEAIGRDIVKKLKGSPLAAKTVGGILCSDLNEVHWRSILASELWSLEQEQNGIMPALRLTYQYLPPHLKSCFLFCSIFSEDHVFFKHDLINMWITLGMVPQSFNGTMRQEDIGSKYFDDMVNKSIFIRDHGVSDTGNEFVMHDLIRDLSIHVSQNECLRTSTNKHVFVPNTVRHLYAHIDDPSVLSIPGLKNLRTLILHIDKSHHPEQDFLVSEMLKGMKSLRVLILVAPELSEFPECVSKLLHLRYLRLISPIMSAFSKSLSKLYLLETMVCSHSKMDVISDLTHLYLELINKNNSLSVLPKMLMQEECFLPSSLQKLRISFCGHLDTYLPKALESVHSLNELELIGCANIETLPPKEVFTRWKTLKVLILDNCKNLVSLESLLGLSSIEYLKIDECPKLSPVLKKDETKRKEEGTMQIQRQTSVRQVALGTMQRQTSAQKKPLLSVDKLDINDPLLLSVDPIRNLSAVRKLTITDCSDLQSLPELPPLLQELYLQCCSPELLKRCEESGPDWPKISQIPTVKFGTDDIGWKPFGWKQLWIPGINKGTRTHQSLYFRARNKIS